MDKHSNAILPLQLQVSPFYRYSIVMISLRSVPNEAPRYVRRSVHLLPTSSSLSTQLRRSLIEAVGEHPNVGEIRYVFPLHDTLSDLDLVVVEASSFPSSLSRTRRRKAHSPNRCLSLPCSTTPSSIEACLFTRALGKGPPMEWWEIIFYSPLHLTSLLPRSRSSLQLSKEV